MSTLFLRAYEFEKRYGLDRLKLTLEKAERAYKTHAPEVIDFCKSALECICKSVLSEKGDNTNTGIQDLPKLIKSTLRVVGHPSEQIGGGITSLVQGIAHIRNTHTLAGHGLDEATPLPTKAEVEIFVKTFSHTVDVILTLLDGQEIDVQSTKMTFGAIEEKLGLAELNEEIDAGVTVQYSPEEGVLYIEGKELKPSEILYSFDRTTYNQRIEGIKKAKEQRLHENFRTLIENELYERFENFHPGHYGVDDIEIDFYKVEITKSGAKITGTASASARLGASSEEDSIDVDYNSDFKAEFGFYDDDGGETYDLEKLELDVVDWIQPDEDME